MKNNIKYMIKKSGLTQKEVSEKMKIRQATISGWSNGEIIPRLDNAYELAKLLNCKIDDLIEEDQEQKKTVSYEEIEEIYKKLEEPEKKVVLTLAKNFLMLYNTECCNDNEKQARLAQLAEHLTLNQGVKGSNP